MRKLTEDPFFTIELVFKIMYKNVAMFELIMKSDRVYNVNAEMAESENKTLEVFLFFSFSYSLYKNSKMPRLKRPRPKFRQYSMSCWKLLHAIDDYYALHGRFYWTSNLRTKVEKALKKSYRTQKRRYTRKLVSPSREIFVLTLDN